MEKSCFHEYKPLVKALVIIICTAWKSKFQPYVKRLLGAVVPKLKSFPIQSVHDFWSEVNGHTISRNNCLFSRMKKIFKKNLYVCKTLIARILSNYRLNKLIDPSRTWLTSKSNFWSNRGKTKGFLKKPRNSDIL